MGSEKRKNSRVTDIFNVPKRHPDYADVFSGHLSRPDLNARDLLRLSLSRTPRWFHAAFWLRNAVVGVFGLKTSLDKPLDGPAINFLDNMPVIEETETVYTSGLPDKHLDFLITVEKIEGPKVSFTTQIWFNKPLGRIYLIAVLPIHKAIIRYYIRQLGKAA